MKGENTFTTEEISELRKLIMKRQNASCDEQKGFGAKCGQ